MGRDVCAFCKKEILPPSRALRSRTSGIVLCEDCVREVKPERENMMPSKTKEFGKNLPDISDQER